MKRLIKASTESKTWSEDITLTAATWVDLIHQLEDKGLHVDVEDAGRPRRTIGATDDKGNYWTIDIGYAVESSNIKLDSEV